MHATQNPFDVWHGTGHSCTVGHPSLHTYNYAQKIDRHRCSSALIPAAALLVRINTAQVHCHEHPARLNRQRCAPTSSTQVGYSWSDASACTCLINTPHPSRPRCLSTCTCNAVQGGTQQQQDKSCESKSTVAPCLAEANACYG